jgi:hypothetical protein
MVITYNITPTFTKEVEVTKLGNGEVMLKVASRDRGVCCNTNHTYLGKEELEKLGNELLKLAKESR